MALIDPFALVGNGERTNHDVIPDADSAFVEPRSVRANQNLLESLILAQDERWRRA